MEQVIKSINRKLLAMRYADNTRKTYLSNIKSFIWFHRSTPINELSELHVRPYIDDLVRKKVSRSAQNVAINSLKFYFEKVLNQDVKYYYWERPKKALTLPIILDKSEVSAIIKSTNNIKHKAMLSLLYSAGLRVGELLAIKINEVDSRRMVLIISQSKGAKDRLVPLSAKVLDMLRTYYKAYKPKTFLFEGQGAPHKPYSQSSVRKIVTTATKKAKVTKKVKTHSFRHAYATHLLEAGISLRHIQLILGHSSSKTTEIYTHVSNVSLAAIISPIDDIL